MRFEAFLLGLGILWDFAFGYYDASKKCISTQKVDTTKKFYHTCTSIEDVVILRKTDFEKLVNLAAQAPGGPGKVDF